MQASIYTSYPSRSCNVMTRSLPKHVFSVNITFRKHAWEGIAGMLSCLGCCLQYKTMPAGETVLILISNTCKLNRFSRKECCKQCRHVRFKGTLTKWHVKNKRTEQHHKHTEHQHADVKLKGTLTKWPLQKTNTQNSTKTH